MFPSKNNPEFLAQTNPQQLLKNLRKASGPEVSGGGSSPVPPGVPIVDSKETRDASYPIDSVEKGNF